MKTRLLLQDKDGSQSFLVETDLEVVPRGIYVVDGVRYQYVGQPTFHINNSLTAKKHILTSVDLVVEKM